MTKTNSQDERRHHQALVGRRGHVIEREDDQHDPKREKIFLTAARYFYLRQSHGLVNKTDSQDEDRRHQAFFIGRARNVLTQDSGRRDVTLAIKWIKLTVNRESDRV